ncbi:MAG TPA: ISLre2 family transposase, partial [Virgibacillus sp.]|nr:ISLre2 family transposase [Virgibacillus sp.]
TYRMKKRGMHWSQEGAEAMVKVKQGMFNGTLRDVYLKDQRRTSRKQRELKRTVKKAQNLHQPTRPSIGARRGAIGLYTPRSSLLGKLRKSLQS